MNDDASDLAASLKITKTECRNSGGGTWVSGTIAGYRFEALVFAEHADNPEWEIGQSRICKLWLSKLSNKETTYEWDRGFSYSAAPKRARPIVDFLTAGLADVVYPR